MIPLRLRVLFPMLAAILAGASASIAQEIVIVSSRVIYPGETVMAEDLSEVAMRTGKRAPGNVAVAVEQLEGKVARRTLLPGRFIPVASVREPYVVEAGNPVQVMLVSGGLVIATTGVPLQPASAGDSIKVRNLDSGAIFSGIAMADGTIRVGGL